MAEERRPFVPYLRPRQISDMESERRVLKEQLENPYVQNKAFVAHQLRRLDKQLETQTPPDLKGEALDRAHQREKQLREEIVPHLVSRDESMRNPYGVVGRILKGEASPHVKEKILEWKNLRLALHKGSDDPDVANIEQYRPATANREFESSQIPRKAAYVDMGTPSAEPESAKASRQGNKGGKIRLSEAERERRREQGRKLAAKRKAQLEAQKGE